MLIYLDANIVQYIADHDDFLFGISEVPKTDSEPLLSELKALRALIQFELEIEQLSVDNIWDVAAPAHLMYELLSGRPSDNQRKVYSMLLRTWTESDWQQQSSTSWETVNRIEESLRYLNLRHIADRRHLAEAIALEASWFLTNDKEIIRKTRSEPNAIGIIQGMRIARPSDCFQAMHANPVLGWAENRL
jgi:hypothetical protein